MNKQEFYILIGLIIFIATALDSTLGWFSLLTWLVGFILLNNNFSFLFSTICLISSVSFKFMYIDSNSILESIILPWSFGLTFSVILIWLWIKLSAHDRSDNGDWWWY